MTDIIDEIDQLVDEQLAGGEPENGYDYDDPTYPNCPHCERHWHGLPITERIVQMYEQGQYDELYDADEDDTRILCRGSEFIGPMPAEVREPWMPYWVRRYRERTERYRGSFESLMALALAQGAMPRRVIVGGGGSGGRAPGIIVYTDQVASVVLAGGGAAPDSDPPTFQGQGGSAGGIIRVDDATIAARLGLMGFGIVSGRRRPRDGFSISHYAIDEPRQLRE